MRPISAITAGTPPDLRKRATRPGAPMPVLRTNFGRFVAAATARPSGSYGRSEALT